MRLNTNNLTSLSFHNSGVRVLKTECHMADTVPLTDFTPWFCLLWKDQWKIKSVHHSSCYASFLLEKKKVMTDLSKLG